MTFLAQLSDPENIASAVRKHPTGNTPGGSEGCSFFYIDLNHISTVRSTEGHEGRRRRLSFESDTVSDVNGEIR